MKEVLAVAFEADDFIGSFILSEFDLNLVLLAKPLLLFSLSWKKGFISRYMWRKSQPRLFMHLSRISSFWEKRVCLWSRISGA
jgi:hypothetical protein